MRAACAETCSSITGGSTIAVRSRAFLTLRAAQASRRRTVVSNFVVRRARATDHHLWRRDPDPRLYASCPICRGLVAYGKRAGVTGRQPGNRANSPAESRDGHRLTGSRAEGVQRAPGSIPRPSRISRMARAPPAGRRQPALARRPAYDDRLFTAISSPRVDFAKAAGVSGEPICCAGRVARSGQF